VISMIKKRMNSHERYKDKQDNKKLEDYKKEGGIEFKRLKKD
jgi:hypothetical protein